MATASLLSRLRRSRRLSLLLFAGSLIALVIAATWFIAARTGLARSYDQLSNRNQLLAQAQMAQQEAQLKVESARSAQQVMDRLSALGLQPEGIEHERARVDGRRGVGQLPARDVGR